MSPQRGTQGRHRKFVFRAQTMPGCAVLLLSLVVLSMGSNARRIKKRGLNHKVRLQILRTEFYLHLSADFRAKFI